MMSKYLFIVFKFYTYRYLWIIQPLRLLRCGNLQVYAPDNLVDLMSFDGAADFIESDPTIDFEVLKQMRQGTSTV